MPVTNNVTKSKLAPEYGGTVTYQLSWRGRARLQLKAQQPTRCPWCSQLLQTLYALLKHLRLNHPRFNFYYTSVLSGARIDVSINEAYDGSYSGRAQDLLSGAASCFGRVGPARRSCFTELIVTPRLHRSMTSGSYELTEFMEDSKDSRSHMVGQNRQYYHSRTLHPVLSTEDYVDSEAELDPPWLRQKTCNMIDEFTDVNEGEKALMKLWNLHIMNHGYLGDCSLPEACSDFLRAHGAEILRRRLKRNLLLHLCNLHDFRLLSASQMRELVAQINLIQAEQA